MRTGVAPRARLGILGGTFNPPHLGHLALARHALRELALERVLLMPARLPPHKAAAHDPGAGESTSRDLVAESSGAVAGKPDPAAENPDRSLAGERHRLEMCRLLIDGVTGLCVSALEFERDGPSYTVDTLRVLRAAQPDTQLTLILGADIARTLPTWREPRELLALAELAVALRAGTAAREVAAGLAPLLDRAPREERMRFLNMPACAVSSSLVRVRVRRGEPVQELVGAAVARYIAAHDLYRAAVGEVPAR